MTDLLNTCTFDDVQQIDRADWHWRSVFGFYDFPRDGIVEWNGQRYWCQHREFEYSKAGRVGVFVAGAFFLYELSADDWREIGTRRAKFIECVGSHWEYGEVDGVWQRLGDRVRDDREHEFYAAYPVGVDRSPKTGKLVAYSVECYLSVNHDD